MMRTSKHLNLLVACISFPSVPFAVTFKHMGEKKIIKWQHTVIISKSRSTHRKTSLSLILNLMLKFAENLTIISEIRNSSTKHFQVPSTVKCSIGNELCKPNAEKTLSMTMMTVEWLKWSYYIFVFYHLIALIIIFWINNLLIPF